GTNPGAGRVFAWARRAGQPPPLTSRALPPAASKRANRRCFLIAPPVSNIRCRQSAAHSIGTSRSIFRCFDKDAANHSYGVAEFPSPARAARGGEGLRVGAEKIPHP